MGTTAGPAAPAGASGRTPPATPAARRSPPRSSAAGHPGYRAHRPAWRWAGRERLAFPGAARPWVRDDGRSAQPAVSSWLSSAPGPGGAALARGWPPAGKGSQARPESQSRGRDVPRLRTGSARLGGPALPEGKAGAGPGAGSRAVTGGAAQPPQRAAAGPWPASRAGWPPARDRRHQPATLPAPSSRPGPVRGRAGEPARSHAPARPGARPAQEGAALTGWPLAGHREGARCQRAAR